MLFCHYCGAGIAGARCPNCEKIGENLLMITEGLRVLLDDCRLKKKQKKRIKKAYEKYSLEFKKLREARQDRRDLGL